MPTASLSRTAQELVILLERTPSARERLFGHSRADVLQAMATQAEPWLVPCLLPFVFANDRLSPFAVRALTSCMGAATALQLMDVDELCRTASLTDRSVSGEAWHSLRPEMLSRVDQLGESTTAILGAASFHANGYVREAAVTRLDTVSTTRELPFLLIRLNDWVENVAKRANEAVLRRLVPVYADALVWSMPILLQLTYATRRRHDQLLERVRTLLADAESRPALERGLGSPDVRVRRELFRLARHGGGFSRTVLFDRALADPDTLVRLQAVRAECMAPSSRVCLAALPRILGDPFPPVRREGILALSEQMTGESDDRLLGALLDRNGATRALARDLLRARNAAVDFAGFYRERVYSASTPDERAARFAVAIAGLGETGEPRDASLLRPQLGHRSATVRRATVRALAALDLDGELPQVVRMLSDASPAVSGTARRLLRSHANRVGADVLRGVLQEAEHAHSRHNAAILAAALSKWESLPMLIEAATDPDQFIRETSREWLSTWILQQNRSFAAPTPQQLQAIGRTLERHGHVLDSPIRVELASVVRQWSPPSYDADGQG